jgi:hypothetical protein
MAVPSSGSNADGGKSGGASTGLIAGVSVAAVVVIGAALLAVIARRRRRAAEAAEAQTLGREWMNKAGGSSGGRPAVIPNPAAGLGSSARRPDGRYLESVDTTDVGVMGVSGASTFAATPTPGAAAASAIHAKRRAKSQRDMHADFPDYIQTQQALSEHKAGPLEVPTGAGATMLPGGVAVENPINPFAMAVGNGFSVLPPATASASIFTTPNAAATARRSVNGAVNINVNVNVVSSPVWQQQHPQQ